jgi:lipopolysaccharide transport system ATP-binding protein
VSDVALSVRGLSKQYEIGQMRSGYQSLVRSVRGLRGAVAPPETIWALKDVSFDVAEGEVVGLVGRNGAGKSTLLKILSRITAPTDGYADVHGRVGALLEVGTGFHGELSGRENVFLNGAILGMRREEIQRKFDEIVDFSGVEAFIDTPVKRYSSGMYLRLAFAVAAFLEPEILIVDEVLAVGDAAFQKRCLGKMGEVANEGRTVLLVSHNMQAVRTLCSRALLIDGGRIRLDGDTESVVRAYLSSDAPEVGVKRWEPSERPGDDHCRLVSVQVTDRGGEPTSTFLTEEPVQVAIEFEIESLDSALCVGFDLMTADGACVLRTLHTDVAETRRPELVRGSNLLRCTIPADLLNDGRFTVNPRVLLHSMSTVAVESAAVQFDVVQGRSESNFYSVSGRPGAIAPTFDWEAAGASSRTAAR